MLADARTETLVIGNPWPRRLHGANGYAASSRTTKTKRKRPVLRLTHPVDVPLPLDPGLDGQNYDAVGVSLVHSRRPRNRVGLRRRSEGQYERDRAEQAQENGWHAPIYPSEGPWFYLNFPFVSGSVSGGWDGR